MQKKSFDKSQHPFLIRNADQTSNRRNVPQLIKVIYAKPITNIILNGENLKSFLSNIRNETGHLLFPFLFNILLEFLARAIRQEEEIKGNQIRKEEVKLFLFAYDMILYLKNPKNF
jgi:hypothetical protein